MYTPSDSQWVRETREREVYQLSEARWSVEGAVVPAVKRTGFALRLLKRLFQGTEQTRSKQEAVEVASQAHSNPA